MFDSVFILFDLFVYVIFFLFFFFFFNDTATTEIYTLSLHDALPNPASTNPSSKIASLRRVSWNLTVWCMLFAHRRAPVHLAPGRLSSPRWGKGWGPSPSRSPQLTGRIDRLRD